MNTRYRLLLVSTIVCLNLLASIQGFAQPANDSLCQAILLSVGEKCNGIPNGDNTGAGLEQGEPKPGCFAGGVTSVWFRFVAPATGYVSINTSSQINTSSPVNDDTEMALYAFSGNDCKQFGNLEEIACNADGFIGQYTFNAVIQEAQVIPGATYYIQVSGWGFNGNASKEGAFCIEVEESEGPAGPQVNDNFCNASLLTLGAGCNGAPNADNSDAGVQAGEPLPDCFEEGPNSVWFKFVGPVSGFTSIRTDREVGGTLTDSEMAVYRLNANDCNDLSKLELLACDQDNGLGLDFNAVIPSVETTPGDTFYIQVSGWRGSEGSFCIEAEEVNPPDNDNLCDAISLTIGEVCQGQPNGDNTGATAEVGEPVPDCFIGGISSVWYSFTAPASGFINISTESEVPDANPNTELALYSLEEGDCADLSKLSLVVCSQDGGGNNPRAASVDSVQVQPNQVYYIQVSGTNSNEGAFCIEIEEVPAPFQPLGDNVCEAVLLEVDNTTRTFLHKNATVQDGETQITPPSASCNGTKGWCGDLKIDNSLWYKFKAPESGAIQVDLCTDGNTTTFDTQVAVYKAEDCNNFSSFTLLGANEDKEGCGRASFLSVFCLTPGQEYLILVDGFNKEEGSLGIRLSEILFSEEDIVLETTSPTCLSGSNGSIKVDLRQGAEPFSFSWSTGDTTQNLQGVPSGKYEVSVIDGCGTQFLQTVTIPQAISVIVNAGNDRVICLGDSTTLGGNPAALGGIPFTGERMYLFDSERKALTRSKLDLISIPAQISGTIESGIISGDLGSEGMYVLDEEAKVSMLDTLSGTMSTVIQLESPQGRDWTAIAWDRVLQRLILAANDDNGTSRLIALDPANNSTEELFATPQLGVVAWIAIDLEGTVYAGENGTDNLYRIDLGNSEIKLIGKLDFDLNMIQDADFDPLSNQLYVVLFPENAINSELRRVDLSGASSTLLGKVPGTGAARALGLSGKAFSGAYEYIWDSDELSTPSIANPIAKPEQNSVYYLSIKDACGLSRSDSVRVTVSNPQLSIETTNDTGAGNGTASVEVTNGIPPYSYMWSNGQNEATAINLAKDSSYTITITDNANCVISETFVLGTTSISEQDFVSLLEIYPNPAEDRVHIQVNLENSDEIIVRLWDFKGAILQEYHSGMKMDHNLDLDISSLRAGRYFFQFVSSKGILYRKLEVLR